MLVERSCYRTLSCNLLRSRMDRYKIQSSHYRCRLFDNYSWTLRGTQRVEAVHLPRRECFCVHQSGQVCIHFLHLERRQPRSANDQNQSYRYSGRLKPSSFCFLSSLLLSSWLQHSRHQLCCRVYKYFIVLVLNLLSCYLPKVRVVEQGAGPVPTISRL